MTQLVIQGSTTALGQLVCQQLLSRDEPFELADHDPIALPRLAQKLRPKSPHQLPTHLLTSSAPGPLDRMLDGASALINCFDDDPRRTRPLIEACLRNQCHYLDLQSSQPLLRWLEQDVDARAKQARVCTLPACGFAFAIGDLLAHIAADRGARRVGIIYQLDLRPQLLANLLSQLSPTATAYFDGRPLPRPTFSQSILASLPDGSKRQAFNIPAAEPTLVPRHSPQLLHVETFLALPRSLAALLKRRQQRPLQLLAEALRKFDPNPARPNRTLQGYSRAEEQHFLVAAVDLVSCDALTALGGYNPDHISAIVLTECALRLRDRPPRHFGLASPASLFDVTDLLETLDLHPII